VIQQISNGSKRGRVGFKWARWEERGGNEGTAQQKEEQRGTSGKEISSSEISVRAGIGTDARKPHTWDQRPFGVAERGLDGLTVSESCCPIKVRKRYRSASVRRKASKLNRIHRAAIWALMRMCARGTAPAGRTSAVGKVTHLRKVKQTRAITATKAKGTKVSEKRPQTPR